MAEPRLVAVRREMGPSWSVAFQLPVALRERWRQWFRRNEERNPDVTYDVQIRVHRKRRTLPQNSMLHARIARIAVETGDDFSQVKLAIKMRAVKRGYRVRTVLGEAMPEPSHRTDTVRCGYLIDECEQVEAELGMEPWQPSMAEEYVW